MTFPYGQGFNFSIAATSVDIEACKRSTNVADGSGMARHEPVTRIEDSAETDGQESATIGTFRSRGAAQSADVAVISNTARFRALYRLLAIV